ncbi:uncharacterized protein C8A04DRAFT_15317 [Dichotomopilus funicola]|uniref:NAD-dependent epimerase/dehydratase domain-containing protein n=1 Tax=Dichotomopilus funicola TaxID=1934379 RepID=A0AAN6UWF8_9PEZI|nr:hypothetical protein C8A04DRAFT_15317 [Dichotomopilus funicola]
MNPNPPPTVLITGSAGHLGTALMFALPDLGYHPVGIDIKPGPTTTHVGSITDAAFLASVFAAHSPIAHVIHTATLHKPHVGSHSMGEFVQTNVEGTLRVLEQAAGLTKPNHPVTSLIFISTTSAFGTSLSPPPPQPAAWITESTPTTSPKNIYGATKTAAEDLCRLVHVQTGLPVLVLRTSRFFPEDDDDEARRGEVGDPENLKVLELAYRRVDVSDVVGACVCAMERAGGVRWGKYVVSGPTPFTKDEGVLERLNGGDAAAVFKGIRVGSGDGELTTVGKVFEEKGWGFLRRVDRVYDSSKAVRELGWRPEYTFEKAVERVARGERWGSELAVRVGRLGYHAVPTGVYTTGGTQST